MRLPHLTSHTVSEGVQFVPYSCLFLRTLHLAFFIPPRAIIFVTFYVIHTARLYLDLLSISTQLYILDRFAFLYIL
jgi:hypothetical protein